MREGLTCPLPRASGSASAGNLQSGQGGIEA
jgi:hypothetical protein